LECRSVHIRFELNSLTQISIVVLHHIYCYFFKYKGFDERTRSWVKKIILEIFRVEQKNASLVAKERDFLNNVGFRTTTTWSTTTSSSSYSPFFFSSPK
jgi:hypothetical protein